MKLKKLQNKKRSGFTLVEMVIVVTVLGILSGLGFMKFGNIQEISRKNADYIAASNLATAANLFLIENPNIFTIDDEDNSKIIDIQKLKTNGYINSIPISQTKNKQFTIKIVQITDGTEISEELRIICEGENLEDGSMENDTIFFPKP